jgi:hypothetical protein
MVLAIQMWAIPTVPATGAILTVRIVILTVAALSNYRSGEAATVVADCGRSISR